MNYTTISATGISAPGEPGEPATGVSVSCDSVAAPAPMDCRPCGCSEAQRLQAVAQTLIDHAHAQASAEALPQQRETLLVRLEQERTAHALQRANAEQARRMADCLRSCHDTLLEVIAQPCFALDRDSIVTRWNTALACWSGVPTSHAEGRWLADLICQDLATRLARTTRTAFARSHSAAHGCAFSLHDSHLLLPHLAPVRVTLLPLCRIPGSAEAIIILLEPQSS